MLIYSSDCRQRWRLRGPPGYRILILRRRNDAIHFEKILPITLGSVVWAIANASYLRIYVASIDVRRLWNRLLCPVVLVIVVVLLNTGIPLLIGLVWVSARAHESILLLLLRRGVCIVRLRCVLRVNRLLDRMLLILVEVTGHYLARRHRASERILFVRHVSQATQTALVHSRILQSLKLDLAVRRCGWVQAAASQYIISLAC